MQLITRYCFPNYFSNSFSTSGELRYVVSERSYAVCLLVSNLESKKELCILSGTAVILSLMSCNSNLLSEVNLGHGAGRHVNYHICLICQSNLLTSWIQVIDEIDIEIEHLVREVLLNRSCWHRSKQQG